MRFDLLKANVAYALGSAANSVALFLLIPFLVNQLSVPEYGAWVIFEISIMFLSTFLLAGMDVGLMRDYWFLEEEGERRRLSGTVLLALLAWGGIVMLGGALAIWQGGDLPAVQQQFPIASVRLSLLLLLGIGLVEALFALLLTLLRIREEALKFVILSVGKMVLFLLAAIAGVQLTGDIRGALAGRFVAAALGSVAALVLTRQLIAPAWEWPHLRRVVAYGLPLLPTSFAAYVLLASDRYLLQLFTTLQVVAVYSFAYKVATVVDVLVTRPFSIDWAPRRFKIAREPDPQQGYARALLLYLYAGVGFALLIVASTDMIYQWVAPPAYQAGSRLVPYILVAYLLYGLSYPLNIGIMLQDKTRYLPLLSWIAAGLCLLLNVWWIPRFGMMGAVWATIVAYALYTTIITAASLHFYPVHYPLAPLVQVGASLLLALGGMAAIGWGLMAGGALVIWVTKLLWIVMVWGALAYFLWGDQLQWPRMKRSRAVGSEP